MSSGGHRPGTVARGRITSWQLALLLVMSGAVQSGTGMDSLLTRVAGRDLWLSILLALPPALLGVWILLSLERRHRGKDLAAMLRSLLGPLAYPVALAYAALFLAGAAVAVAEFTVLSHLVFIGTPRAAFAVALVGAGAYASLLGIEVLARVNSLLVLFVNIPLGLLLILMFVGPDRLAYLLPVLANGLPPVLSGAQVVLGTLGQFVLLLVLLPLAERPGDAGRKSLWALLILGVIALGHDLGPLLLFGGAARELVWPIFAQLEAVQAGRFIERLDIVAIWLWVSGMFVEVALLLHAAALTLANLFGLRGHGPLVLPLGLLITAGALAVPGQHAVLSLRWDLDAVAFLIAGFGLPPLLLLLSALRARRRPAGQAPSGEAAR